MHDIELLYIMQIGNADIDREDKQIGIYEYLAAHALTSDQALSQIYRNCDFSRGLDYAIRSNNCIAALDSTENDIMNGLYNVYNIAILNVINDCAAANLTFPPKKGSVSDSFFFFFSFFFNKKDFKKKERHN